MPGYVPAQLRGLLLVGTLAGAVVVPCAVFALPRAAQPETLVADRGAVTASPVTQIDDRPGVRLTVAVAARAPVARRVPLRATRARRPLPAVRRVAAPLVDVPPMSGSLAERVLAEARRHAGAPYAYGAAGPDRFDCSGFTMYVFSRFGIALPHNAAQQARVARPVASADKQPGDLIFTYHGGTIGHVGIYAGGSQMWAAVATGDVVRLQSFGDRGYSVGRVG
jgi:cell wall-associated NlpC family hydrolase